jgi:hypothetical protein
VVRSGSPFTVIGEVVTTDTLKDTQTMTETPSRPLPCIKCGTVLDPIYPDGQDSTPHAGTVFTTSGHYGSTIFDPMSERQRLEIVICDSCISELARQRLIHHVTVSLPLPVRDVRFFAPGGDDQ